jgi:hypothetical protein
MLCYVALETIYNIYIQFKIVLVAVSAERFSFLRSVVLPTPVSLAKYFPAHCSLTETSLVVLPSPPDSWFLQSVFSLSIPSPASDSAVYSLLQH